MITAEVNREVSRALRLVDAIERHYLVHGKRCRCVPEILERAGITVAPGATGSAEKSMPATKRKQNTYS